MATDIDALLPEVMTHCRACPEPVAIKQIRDAARDLCERALFWREWDQIDVQAPDCEGICTISDASIVRIEQAKLGESALEPVTIGWLDSNRKGWDEDEVDCAQARWITQLTPNTVTIVPKATGTLKVRLVLKPSLRADSLPDFLVEGYATEIGKGAAGRAMLISGTEYQNPQLGAGLVAEFDSLLTRLALKAAKGQQNGRIRTKAQFF